jgi:methenyltetrahydromethanopterin cyclohydrolase
MYGRPLTVVLGVRDAHWTIGVDEFEALGRTRSAVLLLICVIGYLF